MSTSMELVHPLEPTGEESPLARARLHRQLTIEEAARRAGITEDEVRWLEEGRVYRFPCPDDALAATVRHAKQLGVNTKPLPGGQGPCLLYVIVGPARGPGE